MAAVCVHWRWVEFYPSVKKNGRLENVTVASVDTALSGKWVKIPTPFKNTAQKDGKRVERDGSKMPPLQLQREIIKKREKKIYKKGLGVN